MVRCGVNADGEGADTEEEAEGAPPPPLCSAWTWGHLGINMTTPSPLISCDIHRECCVFDISDGL